MSFYKKGLNTHEIKIYMAIFKIDLFFQIDSSDILVLACFIFSMDVS